MNHRDLVLERADNLRRRLTLLNQLDQVSRDLRTAQRDATRRRQLLHTAATKLARTKRKLQTYKHKKYETRTILLISREWQTWAGRMDDQLERDLADARTAFNQRGYRGCKIRWLRADRLEFSKWASVPWIPGSGDAGGSIKLWVTLIHTWDDRQYQRLTDEQWRFTAQSFANNELEQIAHIRNARVVDTS